MFVPFVDVDAIEGLLIDELSVRDPISLQDSASMVRGAAVAAIVIFGVVKISVTVANVLLTSTSTEVMSQPTVSIVVTVVSVDSRKHVVLITDVKVVGSFGLMLTNNRVFDLLSEILLESLSPYGSLRRILLSKELSLNGSGQQKSDTIFHIK